MSCEKKETEAAEPELKTPVLLSSIPANEASNVDLTINHIELVFEEEISIVSKSRIKLNGEEVPEAIADGANLTISGLALLPETLYELLIEELAIKVVKGAVNNEEIQLSFTSGEEEEVSLADSLVVNNPTEEVLNVYRFLKENYGTNIISSAMANVNWNTNEAEWIYQHTGKYPAINTFDFVHLMYSPASWIDYSDITVVEDWWENNGIVSAGWHWNVPTYEGSDEYSFRTNETTFDPANACTEGSWENDVVKADLEKMADHLLLLKEKNIPVIWRPLHEAAGNIYEYENGTAWFWWGSGGANAYKDLWTYMFDFFEQKSLNNLIWVWTTQTKDHDFYPGDEYVDIIGRDIYDSGQASEISAEYNLIQQTYPSKIITLSECGNVAPISDQWQEGAKWSFFMPWYDYERTRDVDGAEFSSPNHMYANAAWWIDAMNQEYVISRDELPDLH
jgi:mannan endo-1,4-beta-mannosidase